jgi:hypothetical protein
MLVPWSDPRCIVCLEQRALTEEHVIPAVVGGRLRSPFLCKTCNNTLGTTIDARLKADPDVRRAALDLKGTLPGLVEAIEEGNPYIGKSAYGEVQGTVKKGEFRARALSPGDGSLLLPNPGAREAIVQMLKKQGRESEIPGALAKFDAAPVNERITVAPGIEIIDWQTEAIRPAFKVGERVPDSWPLKTAYEFLACRMGGAIYSPALEPLREVLRGGAWNEKAVVIERLHAEHVSPIHGLLLEANAPYARVQVRLFRRVCYRVHFKEIAVSGPRVIYHQNLAEPSELFAVLEPDVSAAGPEPAQ